MLAGAEPRQPSRDLPTPILVAQDVSVLLGGRVVFHDASFSVPPGSSLAIIGPNGSGKTVLLKTLLGIYAHTGRITWKPGIRLGYVPQNVFADPQLPLRVSELLEAKAKVQCFGPPDVEAAVNWTGINDFLEHRLGLLSSGQLQRVLIAFALIGSPAVLLVDEPTSSLDELAEQHIFELLEKARTDLGMTIVLVSHDLALVRGFATHVLCLGKGGAFMGTAEEMLVPEVLARVYGPPMQFHIHRREDRT